MYMEAIHSVAEHSLQWNSLIDSKEKDAPLKVTIYNS